MRNIDQVFLYMKDEIEREAKSEEKEILDEVKALEEEAFKTMTKEAKKDADLKLKQEEDEMLSQASTEISESHIERTKKLIEKRDEYVQTIFNAAKNQLNAFHDSDDYIAFIEAKLDKVAQHFDGHCVVSVASKDLNLKDLFVKRLGHDVEVIASDDIAMGGFRIEDPESFLIVDETLDFALENQKEWFNKNSGLIIK